VINSPKGPSWGEASDVPDGYNCKDA
jgi:hypothetical protein